MLLILDSETKGCSKQEIRQHMSDTSPRAIDLILTSRIKCFSTALAIKTGLYDFHLMVPTVLKSGFCKEGSQNNQLPA